MAQVYTSSVINAPASRVWERVRDFNGLPKWHPRIRDSRIEDALPADKVGCIRHFHLQNGDMIREQLLGLSDYDMFCTYSILESPMPLEDYIATLRLTQSGHWYAKAHLIRPYHGLGDCDWGARHRRAWRLFLSRSGWRDALTWRRAHCVSRVTRAGPAWDGFL